MPEALRQPRNGCLEHSDNLKHRCIELSGKSKTSTQSAICTGNNALSALGTWFLSDQSASFSIIIYRNSHVTQNIDAWGAPVTQNLAISALSNLELPEGSGH